MFLCFGEEVGIFPAGQQTIYFGLDDISSVLKEPYDFYEVYSCVRVVKQD